MHRLARVKETSFPFTWSLEIEIWSRTDHMLMVISYKNIYQYLRL